MTLLSQTRITKQIAQQLLKSIVDAVDAGDIPKAHLIASDTLVFFNTVNESEFEHEAHTYIHKNLPTLVNQLATQQRPDINLLTNVYMATLL